MKIIDLSLPIYTGMPVYPGDPEASIELVQTIDKNGWNMRRIEMNSHDGTHVNVPIHGIVNGKNLDDYVLDDFCGRVMIYEHSRPIASDKGLIFRDQNIDASTAARLKAVHPRFIGLSSTYEFDEKIEKELLGEGLILYEKLCNLEFLPDEFDFFGMPLEIKEGDGSPVRAFAILD